jgi:type I restriction enzyme S subunit
MIKESTMEKTDLPVGWENKTLGDLGKPSMCKRILKKQTSSTGDIPFFKIILL